MMKPDETTPKKRSAAWTGGGSSKTRSDCNPTQYPPQGWRKCQSAGHAFAATLAQAIGECLARVIADSTGRSSPTWTPTRRALRAMTSAKRRPAAGAKHS